MLNSSTKYFVPQPSKWPAVGAISLFTMALGAAAWFNGAENGRWVLAAGFAGLVYMIVGWFADVIHESEGGSYGKNVDLSFRWSMAWFIFSEVMFFAAFFGALFYARVYSVPDLGSIEGRLLWPDFSAAWPTTGPGGTIEPFASMSPWGIPAINTLLLLTSGVTLTWAHHALKEDHRGRLILGLALTVALGLTFLGFQIYEYAHAYTELNLKLTSGVFGTTFYLLTGFHGFHVTVGVTMLIVILGRCIKGHFRPEHHFGFEAVAWYWHFVDVVWLMLFVLVYWL